MLVRSLVPAVPHGQVVKRPVLPNYRNGAARRRAGRRSILKPATA